MCACACVRTTRRGVVRNVRSDLELECSDVFTGRRGEGLLVLLSSDDDMDVLWWVF